MSSRLSILTDGLLRGFDWLVFSERGRRLRRWSFLLTLPAAVVVASIVGLGSSLALVVVRMGLSLLVAAIAWRVGGERGEAVRDLLMHPRARRFLRVELRVLAAPFVAARRLIHRNPDEFAYHRGDEQLPIALALAPASVAEAAVVHLLLPQDWLLVQLALAVLHVYGLLWLFAWGAGPCLHPHRLTNEFLLVRSGVLSEARVPLNVVRSVELRRRSVGERAWYSVVDGAVMVPARRRVDLWLELAEPVTVTRPLAAPVQARRLAIAADEPGRLAAAMLAPRLDTTAASGHGGRPVPGLLALPELVYGSH